MPRAGNATCRICGAHRDNVGLLSWTRLCPRCSHARLIENIDGIHDHNGPAFERWRRAMAASVGALLVDDLEAAVDEFSAPE